MVLVFHPCCEFFHPLINFIQVCLLLFSASSSAKMLGPNFILHVLTFFHPKFVVQYMGGGVELL
jgi:hypothetical protein